MSLQLNTIILRVRKKLICISPPYKYVSKYRTYEALYVYWNIRMNVSSGPLFTCGNFAFLITIRIKKTFWYLRSRFNVRCMPLHLCVPSFVVWALIFSSSFAASASSATLASRGHTHSFRSIFCFIFGIATYFIIIFFTLSFIYRALLIRTSLYRMYEQLGYTYSDAFFFQLLRWW